MKEDSVTDITFRSDIKVEAVQAVGDDSAIARAAWISTDNEPKLHDEGRVPGLINYRREETDFVRATSMSAGDIDYSAFFRGLREGGFDGPVVYEMCSPLIGGPSMENLDAKAADFLTYMKSL